MERARTAAVTAGEELVAARVQLMEIRSRHTELADESRSHEATIAALTDRVGLLNDALKQWKRQHDGVLVCVCVEDVVSREGDDADIVQYYQRELAAADESLRKHIASSADHSSFLPDDVAVRFSHFNRF
jgi:hypothetical protein